MDTACAVNSEHDDDRSGANDVARPPSMPGARPHRHPATYCATPSPAQTCAYSSTPPKLTVARRLRGGFAAFNGVKKWVRFPRPRPVPVIRTKRRTHQATTKPGAGPHRSKQRPPIALRMTATRPDHRATSHPRSTLLTITGTTLCTRQPTHADTPTHIDTHRHTRRQHRWQP